MGTKHEYRFWVGLVALWAIFTFVATEDRTNWFLDAGWVVAGLPLLAITRKRFPLTIMLYRLLAIHAIVLIAGGYWTYEKNPIGLWFQQWLGTERNHYDRFGHFLQGFVPAIAFREVYYRLSPVQHGGWLNYMAFMSCMGFTALFELLEWLATTLAHADGDAFLGHQGDVWDAQWDMCWAMIGALLALGLFSYRHQQTLQQYALDTSSQGPTNLSGHAKTESS